MTDLLPSLPAAFVTSVLAALLSGAVWNDIRHYRIPNRLVLAGVAMGLLLNSFLPEGNGFADAMPGALGIAIALAGMGLGLGLLLPLYLLRAMGAGDVKLMAMIGAFLGPQAIVGVVLLTFAIGGALSVGYSLHRKSLTKMMGNVSTMVKTGVFRVMFFKEMPILEAPAVSAGKLPYGIAIGAGTIAYFVLIRTTEIFKLF